MEMGENLVLSCVHHIGGEDGQFTKGRRCNRTEIWIKSLPYQNSEPKSRNSETNMRTEM